MTPRNRRSSESSSDLDSHSRRYDIPPERLREIEKSNRKWKKEQEWAREYEKRRRKMIKDYEKDRERKIRLGIKKEDQRHRHQTSRDDRRCSDSPRAGPSNQTAPVSRPSESPSRNTLVPQNQGTQITSTGLETELENLRRQGVNTNENVLCNVIKLLLEERLSQLPATRKPEFQDTQRSSSSHARESQPSTSGLSRPLRRERSSHHSRRRSRSHERSSRPAADERRRKRSRSRSGGRYPDLRVSSGRHSREEGSRRSPRRRSSSRDHGRNQETTRRSRSLQGQDHRTRHHERHTAAGPQPSTNISGSGAPHQSSNFSVSYPRGRRTSTHPGPWHPRPNPTGVDEYPDGRPYPVVPHPYYRGGFGVSVYRPPEAPLGPWGTPIYPPPPPPPPLPSHFPYWQAPRPHHPWIIQPSSRPYHRNRSRVYRPNPARGTQQQADITQTNESNPSTQQTGEQSDKLESEQTSKK